MGGAAGGVGTAADSRQQVRVRAAASAEPVVGLVIAVDDQLLTLAGSEGAPMKIPRGSISTADMNVGRRGHALQGLAIGAGAGLAVGLAIPVDPVLCKSDFRYVYSRGEILPLTVVARRFPHGLDVGALDRIHLELSLRGKGILIAREAGLHLPVAEDIQATLEELKYLEGSIGQTGLLAIRPLLKSSRHDLWHLYTLEEAVRGGDRRGKRS